MPRWMAGHGRKVAFAHVANVGDQRLGKIAAPVGAGVVEIGFVRAADEVVHVRHRAVGNDAHRLARADRAEIAGRRAEVLDDLGIGGEAKAFEPVDLARLDLVQFVIAAHEQQPDLYARRGSGRPIVRHRCDARLAVDARVGARIDRQHDRLHRALERNAQQFGNVLAARARRRGHLRQRLRGASRRSMSGSASASSTLAA